jgi:hypothetical protein
MSCSTRSQSAPDRTGLHELDLATENSTGLVLRVLPTFANLVASTSAYFRALSNKTDTVIDRRRMTFTP